MSAFVERRAAQRGDAASRRQRLVDIMYEGFHALFLLPIAFSLATDQVRERASASVPATPAPSSSPNGSAGNMCA